MIEQLPSPMNDPQPTGGSGGTQKIVSDYAVANLVVEVVPVKVVNWPSMFGKGPPALPSSATRGLGSGQNSQSDAAFVRVINSEPIKVVLTGNDKSNSVLGSNKPGTGVESLYKTLGNSSKKQADGIASLYKSVSGGGAGAGSLGAEAASLSRAAGALAPAALALLPVAIGLQAITPMLGAIKGGFDSGVQRGAGTSVLGKAAEALGVSFGVILLPAVVKVGGALLGMAEYVSKEVAPAMQKWVGKLASTFGGTDEKTGEKKNGILGSVLNADVNKYNPQEFLIRNANPFSLILQGLGKAGIINKQTPVTPGQLITKIAGSAFKAAGGNVAEITGKVNSYESKGEKDFLESLKKSLAPQASYQGIADVRQQAQLAALNEDPIERRNKEELYKFLQAMPDTIKQIASNTKPQGTA